MNKILFFPESNDGGDAPKPNLSTTPGPFPQGDPRNPHVRVPVPDIPRVQEVGPNTGSQWDEARNNIDKMEKKFPNNFAEALKLLKEVRATPLDVNPKTGRPDPIDVFVKREVEARLGRKVHNLQQGSPIVHAPRATPLVGNRSINRQAQIEHYEAVLSATGDYPLVYPTKDDPAMPIEQRLLSYPDVQADFEKARLAALNYEVFRLKNFGKCYPEDRIAELKMSLSGCMDLDVHERITWELSQLAPLTGSVESNIARDAAQRIVARELGPVNEAVRLLYAACRTIVTSWRNEALAAERKFFEDNSAPYHSTSVGAKFDGALKRFADHDKLGLSSLDIFGLNWRSIDWNSLPPVGPSPKQEKRPTFVEATIAGTGPKPI